MNEKLNAYAESILALERQAQTQEANGKPKDAEASLLWLMGDCDKALALSGITEGDKQWLNDKRDRAAKKLNVKTARKKGTKR